MCMCMDACVCLSQALPPCRPETTSTANHNCHLCKAGGRQQERGCKAGSIQSVLMQSSVDKAIWASVVFKTTRQNGWFPFAPVKPTNKGSIKKMTRPFVNTCQGTLRPASLESRSMSLASAWRHSSGQPKRTTSDEPCYVLLCSKGTLAPAKLPTKAIFEQDPPIHHSCQCDAQARVRVESSHSNFATGHSHSPEITAFSGRLIATATRTTLAAKYRCSAQACCTKRIANSKNGSVSGR